MEDEVRTPLVVLVIAICLCGTLSLAGFAGCRPAGDDAGGGDQDTQPASDVYVGSDDGAIAIAHFPLPVVSEVLGLVAFVSADGRGVYAWSEGCDVCNLVYAVDEAWSVRELAFSPSAAEPYLALTEAFNGATPTASGVPGAEAARRVTVINTETGDYRRVLPNPGYAPQVSSLQWSPDGKLLFANGRPALVVDVAGGGDDVPWDLSALTSDEYEARRPLLSPDFRTAAFTRFYFFGSDDEDLWVFGSEELSPSRVPQSPMTSRGAYPVAWLGGAADGSEPDGPFDFLLVQLGAVGTGGGVPRGLAVINVKTGEEIDILDAPAMTFRAAVVDLPEGRLLVNSFNPMTGEEGRTFWQPLGGEEAGRRYISEVDGLVLSGASLDPGGALALLGENPANGSERPWLVWLVSSDGLVVQGDDPGEGDLYLIGWSGGKVLFLRVEQVGGGESETTLLAYSPDGTVVPVVLGVAAGS